MKIIVKATGQGYWPWLGPQKQFSTDKVAQSDQASRGNFYSNRVEKSTASEVKNVTMIEWLTIAGKSLPNQARNTYATPNEDDGEYVQGEGSNPAIALKERSAKPAGRTSLSDSGYRMEPIPHSTPGQKRARIIYSSEPDDDYVPGRGESRPKRHSPQAFRERRDVKPPYRASVQAPSAASPSNRENPKSMTAPSTRDLQKSAIRRTLSINNTPSSKRPAPPTPTNRLSPEQLSNTTLLISLSSNNYGAIPI